jgi:dTDP-4-dehydrorhamnose 3,5-epimerase
MNIDTTPLNGLLVFTPVVHEDERGFLFESYNQTIFTRAVGRDITFVQDNHSFSRRHVLRGMHYQIRRPQGKLVRVLRGSIFNASVDLRRSSPTFGKWFGIELSAANKKQIWVPEGFAHGFLSLSDESELFYKVSDIYSPEDQRCLRFDDPSVKIAWPLTGDPVLSDKDRAGLNFPDLDLFP